MNDLVGRFGLLLFLVVAIGGLGYCVSQDMAEHRREEAKCRDLGGTPIRDGYTGYMTCVQGQEIEVP